MAVPWKGKKDLPVTLQNQTFFCMSLRQLHFEMNLMHDGGRLLLINGLDTSGRGFF